MCLRGFGGTGGGRKICAGQTLSTGRKGAACVTDKRSREESRSLLLNFPPKTSRISLLRLKECVAGKKKKKRTFIIPYQLLLLVASSFPSSSSAAIRDLSVHRGRKSRHSLDLGEHSLLLGTWMRAVTFLSMWGTWTSVAAGLFQLSTGLKVALLEAGVEERDGNLRDKDLPVLIEVFGGSSFCAAFFFFVFT